jgi:hypothetical protein
MAPRRFDVQIKFQTALVTGGPRGRGRQIAAMPTEGVKKIQRRWLT